MTVGYPGFAAMAAPVAPGKQECVQIVFLQRCIDALRSGKIEVLRPVGLVARAIRVKVHLIRDIELRLPEFECAGGGVGEIVFAEFG